MSERAVRRCDVLIIGSGMAGASLAAELAPFRKVFLAEREGLPGYHSTGRSAALFSEAYGPGPVRALSAASRPFLFAPPTGFADAPLVRPRGHLVFGAPGQEDRLRRLAEDSRRFSGRIDSLSAQDTLCRVPALSPRAVGGGVFEPGAADIDVHALHQGYLRLVRAFGGELLRDCRVEALTREGAGWRADTGVGTILADAIVNAAGAWADEIAHRAGGTPLGLTARRRTVAVVELAAPIDAADWPLTADLDETFYFKPETGRLLVSPADGTPVPPCDVQPEEIDVALAVDRLERLTAVRVRRVTNRWAGLRTFAADSLPVIGWDAERPCGLPGFFWMAGQGGFGIQTAPAAAKLAAGVLLGRPAADPAADPATRGVDVSAVSPGRFAPAAAAISAEG